MASNAQNTADEALENSQITADKISSVNADLQAEVTRAETAETALQSGKADVSALQAETSARQSADETLQNNITAEVTRAETAETALQSGKVDKVTGKQLSTNDYTTEEKTKLAGVAENATANAKTTVTPLVAGTAAIGDDTGFAVGNHVHPLQPSAATLLFQYLRFHHLHAFE
jgi:hypothetical protein